MFTIPELSDYLKDKGADLGLSRLKLADKKKIEKSTGYKVGAIPLIGVELPCIFDECLLERDFIYGGSGNELFTLKIAPKDVKRLNNVVYVSIECGKCQIVRKLI